MVIKYIFKFRMGLLKCKPNLYISQTYVCVLYIYVCMYIYVYIFIMYTLHVEMYKLCKVSNSISVKMS